MEQPHTSQADAVVTITSNTTNVHSDRMIKNFGEKVDFRFGLQLLGMILKAWFPSLRVHPITFSSAKSLELAADSRRPENSSQHNAWQGKFKLWQACSLKDISGTKGLYYERFAEQLQVFYFPKAFREFGAIILL